MYLGNRIKLRTLLRCVFLKYLPKLDEFYEP